jgi:hypothetical protein
MGMGRGFLAAFALLVSVMACLPAMAHASFPGTNGKIAFQRNVESPVETRCTYTANSNGTGEAVLLPPCDPEYRT